MIWADRFGVKTPQDSHQFSALVVRPKQISGGIIPTEITTRVGNVKRLVWTPAVVVVVGDRVFGNRRNRVRVCIRRTEAALIVMAHQIPYTLKQERTGNNAGCGCGDITQYPRTP